MATITVFPKTNDLFVDTVVSFVKKSKEIMEKAKKQAKKAARADITSNQAKQAAKEANIQANNAAQVVTDFEIFVSSQTVSNPGNSYEIFPTTRTIPDNAKNVLKTSRETVNAAKNAAAMYAAAAGASYNVATAAKFEAAARTAAEKAKDQSERVATAAVAAATAAYNVAEAAYTEAYRKYIIAKGKYETASKNAEDADSKFLSSYHEFFRFVNEYYDNNVVAKNTPSQRHPIQASSGVGTAATAATSTPPRRPPPSSLGRLGTATAATAVSAAAAPDALNIKNVRDNLQTLFSSVEKEKEIINRLKEEFDKKNFDVIVTIFQDVINFLPPIVESIKETDESLKKIATENNEFITIVSSVIESAKKFDLLVRQLIEIIKEVERKFHLTSNISEEDKDKIDENIKIINDFYKEFEKNLEKANSLDKKRPMLGISPVAATPPGVSSIQPGSAPAPTATTPPRRRGHAGAAPAAPAPAPTPAPPIPPDETLTRVMNWWKSANPDTWLKDVLKIYEFPFLSKELYDSANEENPLNNYFKTLFDPYEAQLFYSDGDNPELIMRNLIFRYPVWIAGHYKNWPTNIFNQNPPDWETDQLEAKFGYNTTDVEREDKKDNGVVNSVRFAIAGKVKVFSPGWTDSQNTYVIHVWGVNLESENQYDYEKFVENGQIKIDDWITETAKIIGLVIAAATNKAKGKDFIVRLPLIGIGAFLSAFPETTEGIIERTKAAEAFLEIISYYSKNLPPNGKIQVCIFRGNKLPGVNEWIANKTQPFTDSEQEIYRYIKNNNKLFFFTDGVAEGRNDLFNPDPKDAKDDSFLFLVNAWDSKSFIGNGGGRDGSIDGWMISGNGVGAPWSNSSYLHNPFFSLGLLNSNSENWVSVSATEITIPTANTVSSPSASTTSP